MLYSLVDLVRIRFTRRDRTSKRRKNSINLQRAIALTFPIKLRATHLFAASLLLKRPIELCNDRGCMKGLRPAGAAAFLLLMIAPAANAQNEEPNVA